MLKDQSTGLKDYRKGQPWSVAAPIVSRNPDFPGNRKINTCRPANKPLEMNRNSERIPRSLLRG